MKAAFFCLDVNVVKSIWEDVTELKLLKINGYPVLFRNVFDVTVVQSTVAMKLSVFSMNWVLHVSWYLRGPVP